MKNLSHRKKSVKNHQQLRSGSRNCTVSKLRVSYEFQGRKEFAQCHTVCRWGAKVWCFTLYLKSLRSQHRDPGHRSEDMYKGEGHRMLMNRGQCDPKKNFLSCKLFWVPCLLKIRPSTP